MLVKKTVVVDGDQQSSIEINYDRTGKPAVKVKVYDDNSTTIDKRLAEYIAVAEKHSGQKLSPA